MDEDVTHRIGGGLESHMMSPLASHRNTINYSNTMIGNGSNATTMDMTRAHAYQSAAKLRMGKKGSASPMPKMKPIVNQMWDMPGESLP